MNLFLKVQFVFYVIGVVIQLYYLTCAIHPRTEKTEKLSDFIRLLFQIGFAIWTAKLLGII
jgi:hypothetical protein